jgi:hypothetical protein
VKTEEGERERAARGSGQRAEGSGPGTAELMETGNCERVEGSQEDHGGVRRRGN